MVELREKGDIRKEESPIESTSIGGLNNDTHNKENHKKEQSLHYLIWNSKHNGILQKSYLGWLIV